MGMREKKGGSGGFTFHARLLLSPMSQYHNTDVWTFFKTDANDRAHENDANALSWHKVNMLLSGQAPYRTNSS